MQSITTYNLDGRLGLSDLYQRYYTLIARGWTKEPVYQISGQDLTGKTVDLTCYAYISTPSDKTSDTGAFWVLSGVHGEEPAGPNALTESVDLLAELAAQKIPVVLIPLLNPLGYIKDYRYFDTYRPKKGASMSSITDAEHLLPDLVDGSKPRAQKASSQYAEQALAWISNTAKKYPPLIVFDHHEDEVDHTETEDINSGYTYSYCYGSPKNTADLCKVITDLLVDNGFPIQRTGRTWFDEEITEGFVFNSRDGSVDEYLYHCGAKACFVIETTRDDEKPIPLNRRIKVHKEIIKSYQKMWSLLK